MLNQSIRKAGNDIENEFRFLMYKSENEDVTVNAIIKDESIWLTQKGMSELFQTTKQNISLHLKNCFTEGELDEGSVVKDFLTTAADGKNYKTQFYNIEKEHVFTMEDFAKSINKFLSFMDYKILPDKGSISANAARTKAEAEYAEFNKTQKITLDFDKEIKKLIDGNKGDK